MVQWHLKRKYCILGAKNNMTNLKPKQQAFIDLAKSEGMTSPMSRDDMRLLRENHGMSFPAWIMRDDSRRAGRGLYHVPELNGESVANPNPINADAPAPVPCSVNPVEQVTQTPQGAVEQSVPEISAASLVMGMTGGERQTLVPNKFGGYVSWGHFKNVEKIVKSRQFFDGGTGLCEIETRMLSCQYHSPN